MNGHVDEFECNKIYITCIEGGRGRRMNGKRVKLSPEKLGIQPRGFTSLVASWCRFVVLQKQRHVHSIYSL